VKLFSLLLLVPGIIWAQAGVVTEITGQARVKRNNQTIELRQGSGIEQNDQIETGQGRVKITFQDKTTVQITESSRLVVDEFVYDPKSGEGKLGARAALGTVRYVSGSIAAKNPRSVNLRTPTATIAVRGTDFVMSVNESGGSMIILMPSCESNPAQGTQCGSGRIDVNTGGGSVVMDRPYQATVVERAEAAPSPPMTVDLSVSGTTNLQISPPRTTGGQSIVQAARDAASKTGDLAGKDDSSNTQQTESRNTAETDGSMIIVNEPLSRQVAGIGTTDNPNLFILWGDKSQTKQVGWLWEGLSENQRNYTNIIQDMTTQTQIVVSQDSITAVHNFSAGRPQGQISVIQVSR